MPRHPTENNRSILCKLVFCSVFPLGNTSLQDRTGAWLVFALGFTGRFLQSSDLIAMLPSRCIPAEIEASLEVFDPPIAVQGFPLHLAWHKRKDGDRGTQHVAEILRELLAASSLREKL